MAKHSIPDFRFRITNRSPGHTTFQMFVGQPGHGGNAGTLTLTNEEYDVLAPVLLVAGDMLAALKGCLTVLGRCDPHHSYSAEWEVAQIDAEAAIAKARGDGQ